MCVYIYIYLYAWMCTYICVCVYIFVCMYVYIYVCVYVCVYIYICMYVYKPYIWFPQWLSGNLPSMQEMQVQSLGQEYSLEEDMASHSSILVWRIPWAEEPGGI